MSNTDGRDWAAGVGGELVGRRMAEDAKSSAQLLDWLQQQPPAQIVDVVSFLCTMCSILAEQAGNPHPDRVRRPQRAQQVWRRLVHKYRDEVARRR